MEITLSAVEGELARLLPGTHLRNHDELAHVGVDSMSLISVILGLEESFALSIPDGLMTTEAFRTPHTIFQTLVTASDMST